jgi:uncharacterized SAM-binding protein YcdF (DUF218 family)
MFFVLSKTITIFLMPIYWLLALALLTFFAKKRKRLYASALIACAILLTNPFLINSLLLSWEVKPTPLASLHETFEVGIVLTGITNHMKSPHDRIYMNEGADRIMHALMLYRKGKIRKILITGGTVTLSNKTYRSEASALQEVLMQANVPKEDIIMEEKARNTRENALYAKEILTKQFPKKRYLLITSAFHMRRAHACFQRIGVQVTPFSAGFLTQDVQYSIGMLMLPTERSIGLWQILVHEIIGYLTYKVIGYA